MNTKFSIGDKIKWNYKTNKGHSKQGVWEIVDENNTNYVVRLLDFPNGRLHIVSKRLAKYDFLPINNTGNTQFSEQYGYRTYFPKGKESDSFIFWCVSKEEAVAKIKELEESRGTEGISIGYELVYRLVSDPITIQ